MRRHVLKGLLLGAAIVLPARLAAGDGPLGVDPPFHFPKGFDGTYSILSYSIEDIVPLLDGSGRVYVAGRFTTYNDHRQPSLLRLNADGSVDTTFAATREFNGHVYAVALASDGSGDVYAAGSFTAYGGVPSNRIVRLNSDGTLDTGFTVGTGFNTTVSSLALAPDGSGDIYAGGQFTSYQGVSSNKVIRLNADGSRDAGFAIGSGFNLSVSVVAAAPDGDLYVGGNFDTYNGRTGVRRLVRLNPDGTIDDTFSIGTGFNLNEVLALALDPSGDIYAGGSFWQYQGVSAERIVRLNQDGSRDAAFDTTTGANGIVESVALANDGSGDVFIGGKFGSYKGLAGTNRMARLNPDGSLDTSFALGSGFRGGTGDNMSIRAIAQAVDGSGDVLAGGWFAIYDVTDVDSFVRLNSNGTIDPSTRLGSGFANPVEALAAANDGSGDLYVGGDFGFYRGQAREKLARVNSDGTLDTGFATGTGFNQKVLAIAPAVDGSGDVYVGGGFSVFNGATCPRVVRLDSNGLRDAAFNPSTSVLNGVANTLVAATDGSGDVYVGGDFTGRIVRLSATGAVVHSATGTGFNATVSAIALADDGSGDLIVAGSFTSYGGTASSRIIRLNADLTIDTTAPGTGLNNRAYTAVVRGGSVYVGGDFSAVNGVARRRICRLTGSLALDPSFDPRGGPNRIDNAPSVRGLLVTATGRVYAVGKFSTWDGASSPGIAALNADGSRDATFAVGAGLTDTAHAIVEGGDADRDIFVGGIFRGYDRYTVDYVVALDADGSIDGP